MSLVEIVEQAVDKSMDELAEQICGELKAACPKRTGEAAGSIHVEAPSNVLRRIGASNDHLFFADQGNNQRLATIFPVKARALRFTDGTFHGSASTYEGSHFVRDVANRHR